MASDPDAVIQQALEQLDGAFRSGRRPVGPTFRAIIAATPTVELPNADEVIAAAARARTSLVRQLANSPALPQTLRMRLADHPDWQVRGHVAEGTDDPSVHATLLADADARVVAHAVPNALTTEEQLRHLACHRRAEVRATVANDQRTPRDVLLSLAKDRSASVRWNLLFAGPAASDPDLLRVLADDPDPINRSQARGMSFQRQYRQKHSHPVGIIDPRCVACATQA